MIPNFGVVTSGTTETGDNSPSVLLGPVIKGSNRL